MSIFVSGMASWSVWRSPVMLPLSWLETMTAAGVRCSSSMPAVRQAYAESSSIVRPFSEIPGLWKNGVANLYNFWKLDGFRNLHRVMLHNFNTFGPIYRYGRQCMYCLEPILHKRHKQTKQMSLNYVTS